MKPIATDTHFAGVGGTEEDILRAKRPAVILSADVSEMAFSKNDYLKTLELKAAPSFATEADLPRLAQMAGR